MHTGLRMWMLEFLYDKYCEPFDISRLTLYYNLVCLKHYPFGALSPQFQALHLPRIGIFAAKRHAKRGLRHLSSVMSEPRGGVLDKDALEFNRAHQFYHARVEHMIGKWTMGCLFYHQVTPSNFQHSNMVLVIKHHL